MLRLFSAANALWHVLDSVQSAQNSLRVVDTYVDSKKIAIISLLCR